jgi:hypothetical protein
MGGVYTLERIARESAADYWTVMQTLTAFVRERARWQGSDATTQLPYDNEGVAHTSSRRPPTDIAAVISVIVRRGEKNRNREKIEGWRVDFQDSDLEGADFYGGRGGVHLERILFRGAHLARADFRKAHLEGAYLRRAHLNHADLIGAHLEAADLRDAHLEGADLTEAHLNTWMASWGSRRDREAADLTRTNLRGANLEKADLRGANLEKADLRGTNLEKADFTGANLVGADLRETSGLIQQQLLLAHGDAETLLPQGVTPPAHWATPRVGGAPVDN